MSTYREAYDFWRTNAFFDPETQAELEAIHNDEKEIESRFYCDLEFGTAGLRGVLGAGTNRINRYVIRRTTQGLAQAVLDRGQAAKQRGVAIAYDSRTNSRLFAVEAASVLAANGIRAYVFPEIQPTPVLSFAVRYLGAEAGIVITASHNPREYNGYKVYSSDGGQATPDVAEAIYAHINRIDDVTLVPITAPEEAEESGLLTWISDEVVAAYVQQVCSLVGSGANAATKRQQARILYTPLHGAGHALVPTTLKHLGFSQLQVVATQAQPDETFPTLHTPNPEEMAAYREGLAEASTSAPDVIIATDADADRMGVMVRHNGSYHLLTGNQIGVLLLESVLRRFASAPSKLSGQATVIKTIVSTDMAEVIAETFGAKVINTLTGFKFIGEQIRLFETDPTRAFVFGFEESYGYLSGTFVRDKDAVIATVLLAELVSECKTRGETLIDQLERMFDHYGYYIDGLHTVTLPGKEGVERIVQKMDAVRRNHAWRIGPLTVRAINDYAVGSSYHPDGSVVPLSLPKSNVIEFRFNEGGYVILRPSGTEPKIKLYMCVTAPTKVEASARMEQLTASALQQFDFT